MSLYNVNKRRNQCYDAQNRRWFTCDENTSRREGSSPSPIPSPPQCCITPADACCVTCQDLFELRDCLQSALVDVDIPQSPFDTLTIDEVQTLLNGLGGVGCDWLITGGPSGVATFSIRNYVTGARFCVINLTLTNSEYTLSNPGDTIVQCLDIRNDCGGGAGVSIGICYEVVIVDNGIPGEWTVEYRNFRICTNPQGLDEIINCNYCYQ